MNEQKAFLFFKKLHGEQLHTPITPTWMHILRVGNNIKNVLSTYNEANPSKLKELTIAGYGHDSLEDTTITYEEIKSEFGIIIADYILGVTNEKGDKETKEHVRKVCKSSEEIQIIKLSDLGDNYTAISHNCTDPIDIRNRVLPLLEPMYQEIMKTEFNIYRKSSEFFKQSIKNSRESAFNIIDTTELLLSL